jgi:hypothetical protein
MDKRGFSFKSLNRAPADLWGSIDKRVAISCNSRAISRPYTRPETGYGSLPNTS